VEPSDLRAALVSLGKPGKPITQKELARRLRMGKSGWQSVHRWIKDGNTIPGPVQVAVEAMLNEKNEQ